MTDRANRKSGRAPKGEPGSLPPPDLLAAFHLWLHREGGDRELLAVCQEFDWSSLASHDEAQRKALRTLRRWYDGERVDLIGDAEDFHETYSDDECRLVDEQVVRLDGKVAAGHADAYVVDNGAAAGAEAGAMSTESKERSAVHELRELRVSARCIEERLTAAEARVKELETERQQLRELLGRTIAGAKP